VRTAAGDFRRVAFGIPLLTLLGCGTAVYTHSIRVAAVHGAPPETQVAVFDPRSGNSRDWAHRHLGAAPYSTTLSTTATVTLGTAGEARPFTLALAVPELTDGGYFLLEIAESATDLVVPARFTAYEERGAVTGIPSIPVKVTAASDRGNWRVQLVLDLGESARGNPSTP
jgi:hypothetical protein